MVAEVDDYEAFVKNVSGEEPSVKNLWASFGDWRLVGNGLRTSPLCGNFRHFKGCRRVDLHNLINLNGVDYSGKVFVSLVHRSCHRADCPVCFMSWAMRQARDADARLSQFVGRFGVVDHVVFSVPVRLYGLEFEKLLVEVRRAVRCRGVEGGVMIFHGFRYADVEESRERGVPFGWYWSPHFHVLGFVGGRRHFVEHTSEWFLRDGWVAKLMSERRSVLHTLFYQLNHASIRVGVKRFHVARWFGRCALNQKEIKIVKEKEERCCPVCKHELVKMHYFGVRPYRKAVEDCVRTEDFRFWADLNEGLGEVWVEAGEHDFG